jgi:hypothetical protein
MKELKKEFSHESRKHGHTLRHGERTTNGGATDTDARMFSYRFDERGIMQSAESPDTRNTLSDGNRQASHG